MTDLILLPVSHSSDERMQQVRNLLQAEQIRLDSNLDYTCGLFYQDQLIATGSCFRNTLRCLAVDHRFQGEGLLNTIVTHLITRQLQQGYPHLFLYTKPDRAPFFQSLGFSQIALIPGQLCFMENRKNGFASYLQKLQASCPGSGASAAIVMNANPFTFGHQYLLEQAASRHALIHLFLVSDDASLVPFSIRKKLVLDGISHLSNVCCHDTGDYLISRATFPGYFQKDASAVLESQARLDATIFLQTAKALSIQTRYVGEEPYSQTTDLYNQILLQILPAHGITCRVLPRKTANGQPISASAAREAIRDADRTRLRSLVPPHVFDWFQSPAARPVITAIQSAGEVRHH